ncbi:pyridoxal phosphate-dependent aminotransferase [Planococcus alpniumensis]|uniref:pyridoxal phosphate-dependent aminotransferase n=1 Tax=Planococcus alpniumensis TaxID=2708345 RepID=UPI001B8B1232|nr:aminotransferase class I/II-fold pyridoxal phosphate-dependent enzyme [Planococcus sp. MSAK28401]
MKLPEHGANPHRLYEQTGHNQPSEVIDFSENVHPFGPPVFLKERWGDFFDLLSSYPDPQAEPFRSAAAKYHGVEKEQLAAGNGAAEVFTWLAKRYSGKKVMLIEPAFSEYRSTLESENVHILEINLKVRDNWKLLLKDVKEQVANCAALYLCNPHNPTGRLLDLAELEEIAAFCTGKCELVIDEAFIDFIGEHASFIPLLERYPHVIIVRSMTKMYALAGLRLGYVIAKSSVIRELTGAAAHWNVNGLAAAAGARCFSEESYRAQVIAAAASERAKMEAYLEMTGCPFVPSAANFLCFQLPDPKRSEQFFHAMLEAGMVLRHTYSFKGMDGEWFRIGMKSGSAMERLRKEMHQWFQDN